MKALLCTSRSLVACAAGSPKALPSRRKRRPRRKRAAAGNSDSSFRERAGDGSVEFHRRPRGRPRAKRRIGSSLRLRACAGAFACADWAGPWASRPRKRPGARPCKGAPSSPASAEACFCSAARDHHALLVVEVLLRDLLTWEASPRASPPGFSRTCRGPWQTSRSS